MSCIGVNEEILNEKCAHLEFEKDTRVLVSSGNLTSYNIISYLKLTETFITSLDYKLFRDKIT